MTTPFQKAAALLHDALSQRPPQTLERASLDALRRLADSGGGIAAPLVAPVMESAPRSRPPAPEPERAPSSPPAPSSVDSLADRVRAVLARTETPAPPREAVRASMPSPAAETSAAPSKEKQMALFQRRTIVALAREPLTRHRDLFVTGNGSVNAELLLIGDAPSLEEEETGESFLSESGRLLTRIIEAMGLSREEVYLTHLQKWRPESAPGESGDHPLSAEEITLSLPHLTEEIRIVAPKCIVALGATVMNGLIGTTTPLDAVRKEWHAFKGFPLKATYHPAYLLSNQEMSEKRKVWEDMLEVLELLGRPITPKQRRHFLPKG